MSRKKGRRGGQGPRPPQQHPPATAPVEATPPAPEAVPEPAEAPAEPSNVVSLTSFGANASYRSMKGLSDILGVDRSTIDKWVNKHGCPVEREGVGKGSGNEWRFHVPSVFKWHAGFVREQAREDFGGASDDEMDPLRQVQLKKALLDFAEKAGLLVPVSSVLAMQERCYGEIRQTVMSMPSRIGRSFSGFPKAAVNRAIDEAELMCAQGLEDFAKTQAEVIPDVSRHVVVDDDPPHQG